MNHEHIMNHRLPPTAARQGEPLEILQEGELRSLVEPVGIIMGMVRVTIPNLLPSLTIINLWKQGYFSSPSFKKPLPWWMHCWSMDCRPGQMLEPASPLLQEATPMDPKRISSAQTTGHEPLVDEKGIPYGPRRACCAKLASTYFPKWTSFVDGRSFDWIHLPWGKYRKENQNVLPGMIYKRSLFMFFNIFSWQKQVLFKLW